MFIFNVIVVLAFLKGTIRQYGLVATMTGKHCRHAALGRAKRHFVWLLFTQTESHRDTGGSSVPDLIAMLQRERAGAVSERRWATTMSWA